MAESVEAILPNVVERQCGRCRAWLPATEHGHAEWWLCATCRRVLLPGAR